MKSDVKQRRERAIVRLEAQLKAGTKVLPISKVAGLSMDEIADAKKHSTADEIRVSLTDKDRERIQKEIDVLKSRI
jgi:hypothetical protein